MKELTFKTCTMKKTYYLLNENCPQVEVHEPIKWTYKINGKVVHSTAIKELIGIYYFEN